MLFQIVAIAIMIAFYGCYIAKFMSQKKKGIQTDQMGKGKVGFVRFVEITMKTSAILVFVVGIVSILIGTSLCSTSFRIVGVAVSVAGAVSFILAVLTMRDSWRAGVPENDKTELVTNGIFQISRNPAFLGFDLLYIGILLMFFNWVLCAASAFAIVMYHLQIVNVEEDFLLDTFGEAYLQYKKKVCRYIGRRKQ